MRKLGDYLTKEEIEALNEQSDGLPYFDEWSPVIQDCQLDIDHDNRRLKQLLIVYAKYAQRGWLKCSVGVYQDAKGRTAKLFAMGLSELVELLSFAAGELLERAKEINRAIRWLQEL